MLLRDERLIRLLNICLLKGRHGEAAHENRLLCAQKCTRVGWGGGGSFRGGVA